MPYASVVTYSYLVCLLLFSVSGIELFDDDFIFDVLVHQPLQLQVYVVPLLVCVRPIHVV